MGTLDSDIEAGMLEVELALGRSITLRRRVRGAIDTSTLARAYTDTTATAYALREPTRQSQVGKGAAEEFDYTIRKTDLVFDPDLNDQIDDTQGQLPMTLQITAVENAAGGLAWRIRAVVKKSST